MPKQVPGKSDTLTTVGVLCPRCGKTHDIRLPATTNVVRLTCMSSFGPDGLLLADGQHCGMQFAVQINGRVVIVLAKGYEPIRYDIPAVVAEAVS